MIGYTIYHRTCIYNDKTFKNIQKVNETSFFKIIMH